VLRKGRPATVRVRGDNLIGVFELASVDKDQPLEARWSRHRVVHAVQLVPDASGIFSPAEEVLVTFVPNLATGPEWTYGLSLRNMAGTSGVVGRFQLVE
jgi:hypothetical protein